MKRNQVKSMLGICLLATLLDTSASHAVEITQVRTDQQLIRSNQGEQVDLRFYLSEPATYVVRIFDGRDLLVDEIEGRAERAGEQLASWNGQMADGTLVPPEAYRYTITAIDEVNGEVVYDLSDARAGLKVVARNVRWDAEAGKITYSLAQPARVNIRVGLKNFGPLLATVIDWVPRSAGTHAEDWDGQDQSGVLDISDHPNLEVKVDAFSLPDNVILVGPPPREVRLIEGLENRSLRAVDASMQSAQRIHAHSRQSIESRGDVAIEVLLQGDFDRDEAGNMVVSGRVPVRMTVNKGHEQRVVNRRFEPVFYVDGAFTFENDVGFLPFTWIWDTTKVNNGVHYVTANLRGYEGNFGMATVPVRVENPEVME